MEERKLKVKNEKKSFTLIEAIFVIVILSFVLIGGFQIIEKLYVRNYIAKKSTEFEFTSQQTLDQLSTLLYYRIPLSVIGYNQKNNDFKYIGDITKKDDYPILEWIGYLNDAMVDSNLSGFIDLYRSQKPILYALNFNSDFINNIISNKFGDGNITSSTAIIFAGSFDRGEEGSLDDYNNSFGWHGNDHKYVFKIDSINQDNDNCEINISSDVKDKNIRIYEKFYLADTAYSIALKKDLNESKWNCNDLKWDDIDDNTLLLFYNYRPWNKKTFCGDGGEGNVSVLAFNVNSFKVKKVNSHLELKINMIQTKGDINISISKQKVTF